MSEKRNPLLQKMRKGGVGRECESWYPSGETEVVGEGLVGGGTRKKEGESYRFPFTSEKKELSRQEDGAFVLVR